MRTRNIITLGLAGAVLTGCAASPVELDYGHSAHSLVAAQTANPATLTAPSGAPVTGLDQEYSKAVLKALREGVSKPEDVSKDIVIKLPGSK